MSRKWWRRERDEKSRSTSPVLKGKSFISSLLLLQLCLWRNFPFPSCWAVNRTWAQFALAGCMYNFMRSQTSKSSKTQVISYRSYPETYVCYSSSSQLPSQTKTKEEGKRPDTETRKAFHHIESSRAPKENPRALISKSWRSYFTVFIPLTIPENWKLCKGRKISFH